MIKRTYWTKNKCHTEALKYNLKIDFINNNNAAYCAAYRNKWLNDICSHMLPCGDLYNRLVYIYIFPDNYIYIGLTCNIKRRNYEHLNLNKSAVFNHIIETNTTPKLIKLTKYVNIIDAIKKEKYFINHYLNINKYIILNKNEGGGIGSRKIKRTN